MGTSSDTTCHSLQVQANAEIKAVKWYFDKGAIAPADSNLPKSR
jgi:hypothetical protein